MLKGGMSESSEVLSSNAEGIQYSDKAVDKIREKQTVRL
jgi:hypothetical protein